MVIFYTRIVYGYFTTFYKSKIDIEQHSLNGTHKKILPVGC
jgi:hypothetical protein